jgi:hypothetical protein
MSNDDYMVDPLRDTEVRANAKRLRDFLGISDVGRVDVLTLETVTDIWTVKGAKSLGNSTGRRPPARFRPDHI